MTERYWCDDCASGSGVVRAVEAAKKNATEVERNTIAAWLLREPPPDCVRSVDDRRFRTLLAQALLDGEHRVPAEPSSPLPTEETK